MERGRFFGRQHEVDGVPVLRRPDVMAYAVVGARGRPVGDVHVQLFGRRAALKRPKVGAFAHREGFARFVAERKVRDVAPVDGVRYRIRAEQPNRRRRVRLEKGQLEAHLFPGFRFQMSGVVPPLDRRGVRRVVAGQHHRLDRIGLVVNAGRAGRKQKQRNKQVTTHLYSLAKAARARRNARLQISPQIVRLEFYLPPEFNVPN